MSDDNYRFIFTDKLPWHSDVAIFIFSVATRPDSSKMKDAVKVYAIGLRKKYMDKSLFIPSCDK